MSALAIARDLVHLRARRAGTGPFSVPDSGVIPRAPQLTPSSGACLTRAPSTRRRRTPTAVLHQSTLGVLSAPISLDAQRRREAYDNRDCHDGLIDDLAFVGGLAVRAPLRFGSAIVAVVGHRLPGRPTRSG